MRAGLVTWRSVRRRRVSRFLSGFNTAPQGKTFEKLYPGLQQRSQRTTGAVVTIGF